MNRNTRVADAVAAAGGGIHIVNNNNNYYNYISLQTRVTFKLLNKQASIYY